MSTSLFTSLVGHIYAPSPYQHGRQHPILVTHTLSIAASSRLRTYVDAEASLMPINAGTDPRRLSTHTRCISNYTLTQSIPVTHHQHMLQSQFQ
jgi:hypothetical protein